MKLFESVHSAADYIIEFTEKNIRLGIPLGLGKPNQLVNALYQAACKDSSIQLTIFTALSLDKPKGKTGLESRFLNPFVNRIYGNYVPLDYIAAIRKGTLPNNIQVHEFFVRPGAELGNRYVQQQYMSTNYTHAARDINLHKVNVLAQTFAEKVIDGKRCYSMSSNPEVSLDLLPLVEQRKRAGEKILVLGQVNQQLPFMGNHALVDESKVDVLVNDASCHTDLFSMPNMPVNMTEYFVGLNASCLVKDGGTLQIGIGALGDALTHTLLVRDKYNADYQQALHATDILKQQTRLIDEEGGIESFRQGVYGCTEMLTNGILHLLQENIIRRTVYDKEGRAIVLHAGFFLGPLSMYHSLRSLDETVLAKIDMLNISFVNALHGDEAMKRAHRVDARFINSAFSATLLGAGIADQLEDGRVLSGVGGQYNFVAQAHELEGARSIVMLRATRESGGEISSNIVWSYGHTTIPRHLRDIFVSEYGIADLRGQADAECIKRMLNICDSRFQSALMEQAKQAGKLEKNYQIPESYRNNLPEKLKTVFEFMQGKGHFPDFPLGSDFTDVEKDLMKALTWLKAHIKPKGFLNIARNLVVSEQEEQRFSAHLQRMDLHTPRNLQERIYRQLLLAALTSHR